MRQFINIECASSFIECASSPIECASSFAPHCIKHKLRGHGPALRSWRLLHDLLRLHVVIILAPETLLEARSASGVQLELLGHLGIMIVCERKTFWTILLGASFCNCEKGMGSNAVEL